MTELEAQVFAAALELGRHWNAALEADPNSDYTDEDLRRVERLAALVRRLDEQTGGGPMT